MDDQMPGGSHWNIVLGNVGWIILALALLGSLVSASLYLVVSRDNRVGLRKKSKIVFLASLTTFVITSGIASQMHRFYSTGDSAVQDGVRH